MPALQLPLPLPRAVETGALHTFTPPTCPVQLSPSVHVSSSRHPCMCPALTSRPCVPHPSALQLPLPPSVEMGELRTFTQWALRKLHVLHRCVVA